MYLIYRKELCGVKKFTKSILRQYVGISFFMGDIPMSRVADLRKAKALTQRELADLVGVTETTVRNWENNRSGIDWFERVARLCQALDCSPDQLIKYVDPASDQGVDHG